MASDFLPLLCADAEDMGKRRRSEVNPQREAGSFLYNNGHLTFHTCLHCNETYLKSRDMDNKKMSYLQELIPNCRMIHAAISPVSLLRFFNLEYAKSSIFFFHEMHGSSYQNKLSILKDGVTQSLDSSTSDGYISETIDMTSFFDLIVHVLRVFLQSLLIFAEKRWTHGWRCARGDCAPRNSRYTSSDFESTP